MSMNAAKTGYFAAHPDIHHAIASRGDYTLCQNALDLASEEAEVGPVGEFVYDDTRKLVNCVQCNEVRINVARYRFARPGSRLDFDGRLQ